MTKYLTSGPEPLMTAKEVAALLHVHLNTIKRLPRTDLPFIRITPRGDRRYRTEDVDYYINSREQS